MPSMFVLRVTPWRVDSYVWKAGDYFSRQFASVCFGLMKNGMIYGLVDARNDMLRMES